MDAEYEYGRLETLVKAFAGSTPTRFTVVDSFNKGPDRLFTGYIVELPSIVLEDDDPPHDSNVATTHQISLAVGVNAEGVYAAVYKVDYHMTQTFHGEQNGREDIKNEATDYVFTVGNDVRLSRTWSEINPERDIFGINHLHHRVTQVERHYSGTCWKTDGGSKGCSFTKVSDDYMPNVLKDVFDAFLYATEKILNKANTDSTKEPVVFVIGNN
jgi:hypothetical protein